LDHPYNIKLPDCILPKKYFLVLDQKLIVKPPRSTGQKTKRIYPLTEIKAIHNDLKQHYLTAQLVKERQREYQREYRNRMKNQQ